MTTYYSYDAVGTVTWQVQSIPGLGLARTEYDIDAGSGRVKRISFERGRSSQFFTEYDYDADGRLTAVRTSPNGVLWDQDAHYTYAKDGSLRRTVLGEDSLQGIDYTHTLHGQLKGINVPTLDEDDDPGHDGKTSTATSEIPKDVFGMALEYYAGDFDRTGSVFHTGSGAPSTRLAPETPLYGGNVTAWSMKTIATGDASVQHDGELTGETYRYDRIGRLRDATYRIYEGGSHWNGAADSGYSSSYRYDGNGSVLGIDRRGLDNTGTPVQFDEQTHRLTANTNQLEQVVDSDPVVVAGYDDVRGQTSVNYHYDADGRLTSDDQATQTMTYTSDDKVSTVTIGGTTTIERLYGPDGRNAVSASTTGGSSKRMYQIHGGGIDPVAIVTQDGEDDPVLSEILIQGLGRVGVYTGDNTVAYGTTIPPPASYEIYHRTVGRKLYELTDHIGNVRAVIGDVKEPLGSGEYGVQLRSVQNYYPYGMPRPNNVWSAGALTQAEPYRFGFQGMQRDADVGNSVTAPSSTPFRQYDARLARWWSVDPLSAQTSETYQALGGNPISMIDPWGLEITNTSKRDGSKGKATQPKDPSKNPGSVPSGGGDKSKGTPPKGSDGGTPTTGGTQSDVFVKKSGTETNGFSFKIDWARVRQNELKEQLDRLRARPRDPYGDMEWNSVRHMPRKPLGYGDGLEDLHDVLTVLGFIPVVGTAFDVADGLLYLAEGDYLMAGVSAIAIIPVVGDAAKVSVKITVKVAKDMSAEAAEKVTKELTEKIEKAIVERTEREAAEKFSRIGSTGKIGEDALKKLGGQSQKPFETSLGDRIVDQFVEGVAHESKVGYTTLDKEIRKQIAKDVELIKRKAVQGAEWHFYTSPKTGLRGPSGPLRKALEKAGIRIHIH